MFPFFLVAQLQNPHNAQISPAEVITKVNNKANLLGNPINLGGTNVRGLLPDGQKYLVLNDRSGARQEFLLSESKIGSNKISKTTSKGPIRVLEVISDQQEYDSESNIINAKGKIQVDFDGAILLADNLKINLIDNFAVAEGNVVLKRGKQIIRGKRFEYYFVENRGVVFDANGEIDQTSTGQDLKASPSNPLNATAYNLYNNSGLNERALLNQSVHNVAFNKGFVFSQGIQSSSNPTNSIINGTPTLEPQSNAQLSTTNTSGVNHLRFQAERMNFDGDQWTAQNFRMTNDPFSPPEFEIRATSARFHTIDPTTSEITLADPKVVFDQNNKIPLFLSSFLLHQNNQSGYLSFGYDGQNRGGFYIQDNFNVINNESVVWVLSPQYLLQKAVSPSSYPQANPTNTPACIFCSSVFGLVSNLNVKFNDRLYFDNNISLASLDFSNIGPYARSVLDFSQVIGDFSHPYRLYEQWGYQQQVFNGSLGYQTVNNFYGLLLVSPNYYFKSTDITLNFQTSIQDIYSALYSNGSLATLMRYQTVVNLYRNFTLWKGKSLPATPDAGLKYTPVPVSPNLKLNVALQGVVSLYSNGTNQPAFTANVSLSGELGHFSHDFFDYTGFYIGFSKGIVGTLSPFSFDRYVDPQQIQYGLTQQIYGPIRVGFLETYSLSANKSISTSYFIEYSRRSYDLILRYDPVMAIGSLSFQINDFDWDGNPGDFDTPTANPAIPQIGH